MHKYKSKLIIVQVIKFVMFEFYTYRSVHYSMTVEKGMI